MPASRRAARAADVLSLTSRASRRAIALTTVATISPQVADLVASVDSYRLAGLGMSLTDKLVTVEQLLEANEPKMASEELNAFIHQVEAQAGKHLALERATELTNRAWEIEATIEEQQ
jgi:hypothetical protein